VTAPAPGLERAHPTATPPHRRAPAGSHHVFLHTNKGRSRTHSDLHVVQRTSAVCGRRTPLSHGVRGDAALRPCHRPQPHTCTRRSGSGCLLLATEGVANYARCTPWTRWPAHQTTAPLERHHTHTAIAPLTLTPPPPVPRPPLSRRDQCASTQSNGLDEPSQVSQAGS